MRSWDVGIHRVGGGETLSDLSGRDRHQIGVREAIAEHMRRGFELVTDDELAVDVPGFLAPRFYDYIIRDPVTGLSYGVEVKTTVGETVRLNRSQVEKDAIVATIGGRVRSMGLELSGVSYVASCFVCRLVDVRSERLRQILESSGIGIRRGSLPGDIRH
jgi:hypothetical protein